MQCKSECSYFFSIWIEFHWQVKKMPLLSNSDEESIHPFFQLTCLTIDFLWIALTRLSQFSSWCQQFLCICYRILKHQWIRNISITEKTNVVEMAMEVSADTMKSGTRDLVDQELFCTPFHVNWNYILKVSGIIYLMIDFWLNHKFFSVWTIVMKWTLLDKTMLTDIKFGTLRKQQTLVHSAGHGFLCN